VSRLPTPGQDSGVWGTILNDFLSVEHNADGTLKSTGSLSSKISSSALTAKGDLIVASAASTPVAQTVGSNGQVLTADSTQTTGVKWSTFSSGLVNVKDYGAEGDGVTDDAAAIQAAINASVSGDQVFFPGGIYIVGSTIILKEQRSYVGAQDHYTWIKAKDSASLGAIFVNEAWYNNATTSGVNLTISHMLINGNSAGGGTQGQWASASAATTSSVGASIILMSGGTILDHIQVYNSTGHGIQFRNRNRNGVAISNSAVENRIESVKVSTAGGHCIFNDDNGSKLTDGYMNDFTVSGATFNGAEFKDTAGWRITGGHSYTNGGHGINLEGCFSTRISDIYVEQFGTTTAIGTYTSGLRLSITPGRGNTVTGCDISSNELQAGNTYYYIQFTGQGECSVSAVSCHAIAAGGGTSVGVKADSGGTLNLNVANLYTVNMDTDISKTGGAAINEVLKGDMTAVGTVTGSTAVTGPNLPTVSARGDLVVGTGAGAASLLPVGTDAYVLTLDSAQSTGMKWAVAPGASGGAPVGPATPLASSIPAVVGVSANSSHEDHVHPQPGMFWPVNHSYISWSFDPSACSNTKALTAGQIQFVRLKVPSACNISNIILAIANTASGLSNSYVALYQSNALLVQSADQSAAWATGAGVRTIAITPQAVTAGDIIVAIWVGAGSTLPSLQAGSVASGALVNVGFTSPGLNSASSRYMSGGSGVTTPPAANLTSSGYTFANSNAIWCAVS
jgi:hypothetical protein